MEKDKYLYMILDEIENMKNLKKDSITQKKFYKKIDGDKSILRDFDNNIVFASKSIESLKKLIYLPVYEIIMKMSNDSIINYKNQLINLYEESLNTEEDIIKTLKKEIEKENNNIKEMMCYYSTYKKEGILNEKDLNSYIIDAKDTLKDIDEMKESIKYHEKNIEDILSKKNLIVTKKEEEFKEYLINHYNLNNIKEELKEYKVTRSDEIIVNLCNDLSILDEIEKLISEYTKTNDTIIEKTILLPEIFKEYKVWGIKNIGEYTLNKCNDNIYNKNNNTMVLKNNKEIDIMKKNIEVILKSVNIKEKNLNDFKIKINELHKLKFHSINDDLINFVSKLNIIMYKSDNNAKLYNEYKKLVNKKNKTKLSIDKSLKLEKEIMYNVRHTLDDYWIVLTEQLEGQLIGINSNVKFISNTYSIDINKLKDKMIIDVENFSELGLLNIRILIEKILKIYLDIKNELYSFGNDLSYYKDNIINIKNNNDKKLNLLRQNIDNLYFKVSPHDFPILPEDYEGLNKIFKEKTLIDSIVKINRKDLISKVRSESVNYRDKTEEINKDMEIIKKKVLNI